MSEEGSGSGAADVRQRPHYAWVIAIAAMTAVLACIGLGRFALGMLLPSMGQGLDLDYAQMGFVSTGNFVGYLLAMLLISPILVRLGERRLVVLALVVAGLSMGLVGAMQDFVGVLLLYFVTGLASGFGNIAAMTLIAHWFVRRWRGRAAGLVVAGNGLALAATGLFIPLVNQSVGGEGWRVNWAILGLITLLIALINWRFLRNRPAELGLAPLAEGAADPAPAPAAPDLDRGAVIRAIAHIGTIYFLFGASYVIYVTFIVTTLVADHGYSEVAAGRFWIWLGVLSIFSGLLFGAVSDRLGRRVGLMLVFAIHATAFAFAAGGWGPAFLYLSIGLYGIAAWSVPTIITAAVGDYLGAERAAGALGIVTLAFATGQIAGPGLAGLLAEHSGNFALSYVLAAALAATALVVTAFLRRPEAS